MAVLPRREVRPEVLPPLRLQHQPVGCAGGAESPAAPLPTSCSVASAGSPASGGLLGSPGGGPVSYTHLRAHETSAHL
eukprot:6454707-Alexandrium_andersonii.AAC.1